MIELRQLHPAAATELAVSLSQLHRQCFPEDPWPTAAVQEIMALSGFFGLVASEGCDAGGFVLAQAVADEAEILSLGVVPARRRAGLGTSLLAGAATQALNRGARALFLEVAEDNMAARRLYRASGFVLVGRRINYYRRRSGCADALIMRLGLAT